MKKEDLRVTKTKKLIYESFIELVELKGYQKVKVSNIVERANINRNTFYLHFQDKEDLTYKMINEMATTINDSFDDIYKDTIATSGEITEFQIRLWFRYFIRFVRPNFETLRIILVDNELRGHINFFNDTIRLHLQKLLDIKNPRSNLVFEYAFNGMIGVFSQYITYSTIDEAKTVKTLASLAYDSFRRLRDINYE